MTNATIMFAAFIVAVVSVVIVFVAGAMSGVVRLTTLLTRTFFAFLISGAASYLLLMIFDWYYEKKHKEFSAEGVGKDAKTTAAEVNISAEGSQAAQPAQEGFKPMNANELPKA